MNVSFSRFKVDFLVSHDLGHALTAGYEKNGTIDYDNFILDINGLIKNRQVNWLAVIPFKNISLLQLPKEKELQTLL